MCMNMCDCKYLCLCMWGCVTVNVCVCECSTACVGDWVRLFLRESRLVSWELVNYAFDLCNLLHRRRVQSATSVWQQMRKHNTKINSSQSNTQGKMWQTTRERITLYSTKAKNIQSWSHFRLPLQQVRKGLSVKETLTFRLSRRYQVLVQSCGGTLEILFASGQSARSVLYRGERSSFVLDQWHKSGC